MPEIKTNTIKDIKILNKTTNLSKNIKNAYVRTKEKTEEKQNQNGENANIYATDKVSENVKMTSRKAFSKAESFGRKSLKRTPDTIRKIKKQAKNIKTATKGVVKTTGKSVKTAKTAIKTSQQTVKATAKTVKFTIKASQKAFQVAKLTAKATAKAVIATVKATIAAVKGTIALIAAGGWVAVVIILIICMFAFIISSPFGIFTCGGTNNTPTVSKVVTDMNNEWNTKINEIISDAGKVDSIVYTINGTVTNSAVVQNWADVLSVFAIKINPGDNSTNIPQMDENKINILKTVFFDMNTVTSKTETSNEKTTLTIQITSKSYLETIPIYDFNSEQQKILKYVMDEKNKQLWDKLCINN